MRYLVGGYTMLNDIVFSKERSIQNILGGSVFSATGIKLWRDDVLYVGAAGHDFERTFGVFFKKNAIRTEIRYSLPATLHYRLVYGEDGKWQEETLPGKGFAEEERHLTWILPEQFLKHCGRETRGIYLEAALNTKIVRHFQNLKKAMPNGKLMWEIATQDLMNPEKKEEVIKKIQEVDIYSLNWNEAKVFLDVSEKSEAIEKITNLGKPCFFRTGSEGAWYIDEKQAVFQPSLGVEESVDPTGCGNCSTATALIGFAEGLSPEETLIMANISAALNARQYGPWPQFTQDIRRKAFRWKESLMKEERRI